MQVITLAILLLLAPTIAEAQRRSGSGISGGIASASSVDFVRINWGPPDSIQLVAAVLFRGSTEWGALKPQESDWAHRAADSARIAAESRGNQAGGTITPRATAWIEYDDRQSVLVVLNQSWRVPRRDSALVLLVDRIDRVGGPPLMEAVMIGVSPLPENVSGTPGGDAIDAMYNHWNRALRGNERIRVFMESMR